MPLTDISWGHDTLRAEFVVPEAGTPHLRQLAGGTTIDSDDPAVVAQPLVELVTADDGLSHTSPRYSDTPVGRRLRYRTHQAWLEAGWHQLRIELVDDRSGLEVALRWASPDGVAALRSWTEVTNAGEASIHLDALGSLSVGWSAGAAGTGDLELTWARTEWVAESRWRTERVRLWLLPDLDGDEHGHARGRFAVTSRGAWSTGSWLPMGTVRDVGSDVVWAWQVEHQGAWHWEVGERRDGWYLTVSGPTDAEHRWRQRLEPGERFVSVPAALAVSHEGRDAAIGELTRYRRAARRDHPALQRLPVVFNDYMNTLMGAPTTQRLLPLIEAAAEVGAEYLCIDAGWYDDGGQWWGSVGAWEPSTGRFPGGIEQVIDAIRAAGMRPGLWLEPEVVGVHSPIADTLPDDAFFQRDGRRVVVSDRYHLDLRHPAAVAHLDQVVDRLVSQLGIDYLKLDHNIDPGDGTDVDADSLGAGLLAHNRAHLRWLEGVLDRHPELVVENCASGAMRMDPALLARLHLQSTSDQQNPHHYPPIAAAAPMLVPPEQAGNWAYPQPEMDDEAIVFTVCTGLAGRLYLSGHLDRMSPDQRALVADGVATAKRLRADLAAGLPIWPLGLPDWDDPWIASGWRTSDLTTLVVWHRSVDPDRVGLRLPHLRDHHVRVVTAFPAGLAPARTSWEPRSATLWLDSPGGPYARALTVTDIDADDPSSRPSEQQ